MRVDLKVLEITHGLGVGGAEVSILNRLRVASEQTVTTVLNTKPALSQMENDLRDAGAHVISFNLISWGGGLRLLRYLKRQRADVILLHSPTVVIVVLALACLRILRTPVVVQAHNERVRWVFALPIRLLNGRAYCHLAVSKRVAASVQCAGARRVRVRYLGALEDRAPLSVGGLDTGRGLQILWAGRFNAQKRVDVAIEAISLSQEVLRRRGCHISFAGTGPLHGAAVRLSVQYGVADLCSFPGVVRPLSALMDSSDVLLITSDYEGLPIVLFEGLLRGMLVVASAVGGIPEVLDIADGHIMHKVPARARSLAVAQSLERLSGELSMVRRNRTRRADNSQVWRTEPRTRLIEQDLLEAAFA